MTMQRGCFTKFLMSTSYTPLLRTNYQTERKRSHSLSLMSTAKLRCDGGGTNARED